MNTTKQNTSALNWFGGKSRHLDWLLPLLDVPHHHYIEPFAGSAVVFFNKKPSPIETISDAHGRLINYFRILRERPGELTHLLNLTAYSRSEFDMAKTPALDPVEDARRIFVLAMMCYGGRIGTSRESWRSQYSESRNGMSLEVSKFQNRISRLYKAAERLRMAQIENKDAFYMIDAYDGPLSLFYLDPTYPRDTRTSTGDYQHEMSEADHIRLLERSCTLEAKVAISSYDNELYNHYLSTRQKHIGPDRQTNLGKRNMREVLYTNYTPSSFQKGLFA